MKRVIFSLLFCPRTPIKNQKSKIKNRKLVERLLQSTCQGSFAHRNRESGVYGLRAEKIKKIYYERF